MSNYSYTAGKGLVHSENIDEARRAEAHEAGVLMVFRLPEMNCEGLFAFRY